MKKNILSVMVFLFVCCGLIGQTLTPMTSPLCKPRAVYGMVSKILDGEESTLYLYSQDFFAAPSRDQEADALFTINVAQSEVTQMVLNRPKNIEFLNAIESESEVIGFYFEENKKEGVMILYMNKISKNDEAPVWDPILLNTFPSEKKDNNFAYLAVSPDKSKAVLCYMSAAKKGDFKGSMVMTFDNTGERIWDTDLELDFSNRTFQILDILIDNEANAYVGMVSYKVPGKNTRTDEKLHMYEINSNNINTRTEDISFGHITNGRMLLSRNGDVCLGGYYCTNPKENENGTYMVRFDTRYSSFKSVAHQNFPSNYKEKVVSKLFSSTVTNQSCYVKADKLVEFDNNNVALIGEQRNITKVVDNKGMVTYNYFAKHIMFTLADENGDIQEFKMFDKDQATASGNMVFSFEALGLSYYPFFKDNKLYMLFADNVDNFSGESGNTIKMYMNNKHCTAMLVVDETGKESKQQVINSKVAKGRMFAPLSIEDDGFVIIFLDKKGAKISKLTVEL